MLIIHWYNMEVVKADWCKRQKLLKQEPYKTQSLKSLNSFGDYITLPFIYLLVFISFKILVYLRIEFGSQIVMKVRWCESIIYLFIHIDTNNWGLKVPGPY